MHILRLFWESVEGLKVFRLCQLLQYNFACTLSTWLDGCILKLQIKAIMIDKKNNSLLKEKQQFFSVLCEFRGQTGFFFYTVRHKKILTKKS